MNIPMFHFLWLHSEIMDGLITEIRRIWALWKLDWIFRRPKQKR